MSPAPQDCPLSLSEPETVRRLREVFDRAGYTEHNIGQALGVMEWPTYRWRRRNLFLLRERTRGKKPLDSLIRLFLLEEPVARDAMHDAVRPLDPEDLKRLGLLRGDGDDVRGNFEIDAFLGVLAAADWPSPRSSDFNQVMGIGATSRLLAQMTIRRRASSCLDLGTGCGVLAFLATAHCDKIAAVDRNPRALLLGRFNAQLNDVSTVDFLEGDLFAPVEGSRFDLIFCNPPFVIGPRAHFLHSHSGLPSDQLCQSIIQIAPAFLNDGGYFQVICNWALVAGQDWRERLAGWFAGTGCDAWVLHFRTQDAAAYAADRIEEMDANDEEGARHFDEWMAYYQRERIEAIGFGSIALRRSGQTANWFRCERAPELRGPCGESMARGFVLRDFLENHRDDRALLKARFRHSPDLLWEQESSLTDGGWTAGAGRLQIGSGLMYTGNADRKVLDFVAQCKGKETLEETLMRMSGKGETQRPDPSLLSMVRRLVEVGCLVPIELE